MDRASFPLPITESSTFARVIGNSVLRAIAGRHRTGMPSRNRDVLLARFGLGECEPTLSSIGRHFGVSRQAVTEILAKCRAAAQPPSSDELEAARTLLDEVEKAALLDSAQRDATLLPLLGPRLKLAGALNFCEDFLGLPRPTEKRDPAAPAPPPQSGFDRLHYEALREAANSLCYQNSAADVVHLAGVFVLRHQLAPSEAVLVELLDATPGVTWLDRDLGWFTCQTREGPVVLRVKKMLAVAQRPLGAEELIEGLMRDRSLIVDGGPNLVLPPPSMLLRSLARFGWAKTTEYTIAATDADSLRGEALSQKERGLFEHLASVDGIDTLSNIDTALATTHSSPGALRQLLLRAPFVRSVARGVVGLRGWAYDFRRVAALGGNDSAST